MQANSRKCGRSIERLLMKHPRIKQTQTTVGKREISRGLHLRFNPHLPNLRERSSSGRASKGSGLGKQGFHKREVFRTRDLRIGQIARNQGNGLTDQLTSRCVVRYVQIPSPYFA